MKNDKLEKLQEKIEKSGIVYLNNIAPSMDYVLLRNYLNSLGHVIDRIYLSKSTNTNGLDNKTKEHKGTRRYNEGWVEFLDKKKARNFAALFNNTRISNTEII